ncbi:depupylase/deamidase Dop [Naumannella halotolerans]|uniref:Proteasome accessory factor A n=1 Tax=Naumannella halotolerans TaxID=993414 RepID=A0A4R7JA75_9ACTN|nr:depupylase/deamidase Dop [Naumannella halotolerans]TDT33443.1 proteasome accessory factor A [Naumannella halotolerans]
MEQVFGLETEYGITVEPGSDLRLHEMYLSNHVVRAYSDQVSEAKMRWDYETESPLRDLRGFDVDRTGASPDMLTDVEDGLANVVLSNGARFYVDHAHPEYSGPEVRSARDAVKFDAAGDEILLRAAAAAARRIGTGLRIWKNNTDGKGASYGTHENYLLSRRTPFHRVVVQFTGFLASRSVITGAGRIGIGQHSEVPGFQLSQRADFFEAEVGLETTMNRPIINTRDEPHADSTKHRRLHVITGDANCSQTSTWLKVGTAALVLRALEAGDLDPGLVLADPVHAFRTISHDADLASGALQTTVALTDGRRLSGLDLQEAYAESCRRHLKEVGEDPDSEAHQVLDVWQATIDQLRTDPLQLADRLDWVAKWRLTESYRRRDGLGWDDPKLALIDLQYADLDPRRSLYRKLLDRGRIQRLVSPEEVDRAITEPPEDTRAYFRGRCVGDFGRSVVAASWDSLILEVPGRAALLRLPTPDPLRGTKAHVGELMDASKSLADLVDRMSL